MKKSILWLFAIAFQLYKLFQFRRLYKQFLKLKDIVKDLEVLKISDLQNQIKNKIINVGEYVLC